MKRVIFWLAWRNLVGHGRRTGLTVAAIAAGLGALIFLWAFSDGLHRNMQGNFQEALIGSLQVHRTGFFANPKLERHIRDLPRVLGSLEALGITAWTRRLETYGLAASQIATEGTFVMGVDPAREPRVTQLHRKVTHGRFLRPGDGYTCVLGATAARNLAVGLGDELILLAYDRYGVMSAEGFRVVGIISSGEMGIDRGLMLAPLAGLQEMLEMGDLVTDVPVRVDADRLDAVAAGLRIDLAGEDLEVMRWHDMFPIMQEWATVHNGFMYLFLGVVLFIVLAGVLNTMLLSMLERIREFGVFLALGNRHREIGLLVMAESALIGVAGSPLGTLLELALVRVTAYTGIDMSAIVGGTQRFYVDPVIRPTLNLAHLLSTVGLVLAVTVLAGIYPAWRAGRLSPAEAIRHV